MVLTWARHLRFSAFFHLPLKKKKKKIIFGCAGSSSLPKLFYSSGEQGLVLIVVAGLLTAVASLVVEHRL